MTEELEQVLERVKYLFLKYGIKSVTMDDIARELGISKKTLYQHVSDKTQLIEKIIEIELKRRKFYKEELHSKNLNAVEELLEVYKYIIMMLKEFSPSAGYDLKKYYPELFKKITKARQNFMMDSLSHNINKGIKEGLYRSDFDMGVISRLCVARFEAFLSSELFTREEIASAYFIKELFIYHIRGIANEKGHKILEEKQKNLENENKK